MSRDVDLSNGENEEGTVADESVADRHRGSGARRVVLLIAKDEFGQGPSDLGGFLMRSFLKVLGGSETRPERAIFMNAGVRLTTEGSEVLDEIQTLENAGVEILSCGTCLDYFDLKEKLKIGKPTNMNETVAALMAADHVVCP